VGHNIIGAVATIPQNFCLSNFSKRIVFKRGTWYSLDEKMTVSVYMYTYKHT